MRRGLILALTQLKDFAGAVDQYIEIIARREDDALISEAALYAQRNGRQPQLLEYYADTMKQSPRDYRWPMALAKIQTQVEDYPAAVDTYATAINIRSDRVDLRTTRAELLERLMRFDESAAEYQKLFELNYHDTRCIEKVAEIRARQGKTVEVVAVLSAALIENRPEKPANFFDVATRLEGWGMIEPAREFAQKGVDSAGRDLLAVSENHEGVRLYVDIMTRLRQEDTAYFRLQGAVADATPLGAEVSIAVQQVEKKGISPSPISSGAIARSHAPRLRLAQAWQSMMQGWASPSANSSPRKSGCNSQIGWKSSPRRKVSDELATSLVPTASAAGLPELQARWLKQLMLSGLPASRGYESVLSDVQTRRMKFEDLGTTLETYAQQLTLGTGRNGVLAQAADAYRSGALYDAEFNVVRRIAVQVQGGVLQRYFELLLQRNPQELVQLAATSTGSVGDAACQYVIAHGPSALAQQAVAARGRSLEPVWSKAYSGLTGLYFADRSPAVNAAFLSALGDGTTAERLGKPVDRQQQLAGQHLVLLWIALWRVARGHTHGRS